MDSKEAGGNLSKLWIQATVFGALWGALEVTLGVLLHTIRLPFSGIWLAGAGSMLLIAGLTLYPRRGFALRAGVVCMLMKLITPGIKLFTPVIGIGVEALLIEAIIGRGRFGYARAMIAAATVALSVIVQGLIFVTVIYGWDLLLLYYTMLKKSSQWLGIEDEAGVGAILVLVAATAVIGAAFGAYGLYLGRMVKRLKQEVEHAA